MGKGRCSPFLLNSSLRIHKIVANDKLLAKINREKDMTSTSKRGIHLAWIVVEDFKKAVKFYTEVVGFKVTSIAEEYGWAELCGEDGALLGIAQNNPDSEIGPGENAVVTISVNDIEAEIAAFQKQHVTIVGSMLEVPGHVKMQSVRDPDGNLFQLVQTLD